MRKLSVVLASSWLLGAAPKLFANDCTHTASTLKCLTYVDNYDGDTLTLHIPRIFPFFGKNAKVRINGIDTPELKGKTPCEREQALKAKEFLQRTLSQANKIELRNIKKEKYFRVLGDLYADGKNIGLLLLKAHLAVPYDGGHKNEVDWCGLGESK